MKATLNIQDNSWGSLYCRATVTIEDGKIIHLTYKGSPRINGDGWFYFLSSKNVGDILTLEDFESIVNKYHGRCEVTAKIRVG